MVIALIYIFATAKPVSTRRLATLFVSTLALAVPALKLLQVRNVQSDALSIATALTLLVWSTPLMQAFCDSVRRRSLALDSIRRASAVVRWTYGFALVVAPTVIAFELIGGSRGGGLPVGVFAKLLMVAAILACVFQAGIRH